MSNKKNTDSFSSEKSESGFSPCEIREVKIKNLIVAARPVTKGLYKSLCPNYVCPRGEENFPATEITWNEAALFLNRLSEIDGFDAVYDFSDPANIKINMEKNGWRLPFEKEWEMIARTQRIKMRNIASYAWTAENSDGKIHESGLKKPSAFGVYDLFGLVWEWCSDSISDLYGKNYRVIKGGSWDACENMCSVSESVKVISEFKSDAVGFRPVKNM